MAGVGAYKTPFPGGAYKTPLQTPFPGGAYNTPLPGGACKMSLLSARVRRRSGGLTWGGGRWRMSGCWR